MEGRHRRLAGQDRKARLSNLAEEGPPVPKTMLRRTILLVAAVLVVLASSASSASAQQAPAAPFTPPTTPAVPLPADPATSGTSTTGSAAPGSNASINISLPDTSTKPSQSVLIILILTVLSVAPALLIMMTSFTRIAIVLSLTRNAMGLQGIPPNQVIVGLSLFLSLFVMGPTFTQINHDSLQPLLHNQISQGDAYNKAVVPIREFMFKQTRTSELTLFVSESNNHQKPASASEVPLNALIPAFILSELKTAFIIGFIIFIPFLVIDIIVSSSLMSMGMMMLPPSLVSLPFKLLLFVMVDGWGLVVRSLLQSFQK
jgi:flagellar biosynthesis protein FliP